MPEVHTEVAVGVTDGYRYIAIKPPLDDVEIELLIGDGVIRSASGHVEQITIGPNCTMLRGGWDTDRAQITAKEIATRLRLTRGAVGVDLTPVDLTGFQSSPFNPVTR